MDGGDEPHLQFNRRMWRRGAAVVAARRRGRSSRREVGAKSRERARQFELSYASWPNQTLAQHGAPRGRILTIMYMAADPPRG